MAGEWAPGEGEDLVVDVLAFSHGSLSFTARGLLAHLMGSGKSRHSVAELVDESGTGRDQLIRAIRELEDLALVRLASADDAGPTLATVTDHPALDPSQPVVDDPPDPLAPAQRPGEDPESVAAGIAAARAAVRAVRDEGRIPSARLERRPYLPPRPPAAPLPDPSTSTSAVECEHDK